MTEGVKNLGQAEFFYGLDGRRHQPEGPPEGPALEMSVHAESCVPIERVGEVHFPIGLKPLALILRQDAVYQLSGFVGLERRVVQVLKMSVDPDDRRHPHRKMEVGPLLVHHFLQNLSHIHGPSPLHQVFASPIR